MQRTFDIWSMVDQPLHELRAKFQMPSLSVEERAALASTEALLV